MIDFTSFTLDNGLRVVVHEAPDSAIAVLNIMYDVGSRDEAPDKTGFAHLFEHLMFGGSRHIPAYDSALQQVGGDNNAFTTTDVTNYYCTLPAANLETAFWLESDRMLGLSFDPQVLAVQQKVVIEEFKERYLNQPYGEVWLKLSALAYTTHPYRWPTIGRDISHIEQATMGDVKEFFGKFYVPNNAVLVVAGGVTLETVKELSKKWFEPIPAGPIHRRNLPQELPQAAPRCLSVTADVPLNALYKAYHMPGRLSASYHAVDLLATLLGEGRSSRLYAQLVDELSYFNTIAAYTMETADPGLLLLSGTLNEGVSFEAAEAGLQNVIEALHNDLVPNEELDKAKNHLEAYQVFSAVDILHCAQELAHATLLGDTNLVNQEVIQRSLVTPAAIQHVAQTVLQPNNSATLHYRCG